MISMIVAMDRKRGISMGGKMPWPHFRCDRDRFKAITHGNIVVMGRRTWESLPKPSRPLIGRKNIVITSDVGKFVSNVRKNENKRLHTLIAVESFDAAITAAKTYRQPTQEIIIMGGQSVYEAAYPIVDRMYITAIDHEYMGCDRFFLPDIDIESGWNSRITKHYIENDIGIDFHVLNRIRQS